MTTTTDTTTRICSTCGIATPYTPDMPDVTLHSNGADPGRPVAPERMATWPVHVLNLTRCARCQGRQEQAAALVAAHPRVAASIGSPAVAADLTAACLAAFDAIGRPTGDQLDAATTDARTFRALLAHLSVPGSAVLASARLTPFWSRSPGDLTPESAAPAPFDYLTEQQRAAIRTGVSSWLAARLGRARQAPPPSGAACGLCGIATQSVRPGGNPLDVWHGPHRWKRSSLGARGRAGMEVVEVWCCGACEEAYERTGSVGPTLIEKALYAALGAKQRGPEQVRLEHAEAWAARDREPNAEPWSHLRLDDETKVALGLDGD